MGIRTKVSAKPEKAPDHTDQRITVVVDNGGGGGGEFDANVYFEYNGSVFSVAPDTATAKNPDPKNTANKQQGNGPTMQMSWDDQTIKWTHEPGPPAVDTGKEFTIVLRYSGPPVSTNVAAWAWQLKDGQQDKKSNVAELIIEIPK